ncbi:sensor histidine kinase [Actinokineospora iranica]|uniref:histidine kinase n=1 Tax=Actinokineospora iranica TaxID=1271860 RepID=A0A1G6WYN8_9PSEU|nr:sensor histidine kinase [Actinokineospora iranica]SDD70904.1 Signal transduction histidine kinase [Actinokineospora iranica]
MRVPALDLSAPNRNDLLGAVVLLTADIWFNVFFRLAGVPLGWTLVFLASSTFPLGWRRQAPTAVLAVIGGVTVVGTVLHFGISEVGVLIALYTVAAWRPKRTALRCLIGFAVLKTAAELVEHDSLAWLPMLLVLYCTAFVLGDQQRTNRVLVEHEREARVRLATEAERGRIARELHDVVAHTVSVMVLYTSVARRAVARDPAAADTALAQVEESGRQSLTELRRLLGVLRTEPGDLAPQASLADLDDLVSRCVTAGLPVTVAVHGHRRELPAGVELCAYRIVQEALTNAAKHADPTRVTVDLHYGRNDLRIDIRNDGPRPCGTPGHGLIGMRERAALVGGRLHVRHDPDEFQVVATLPYRG